MHNQFKYYPYISHYADYFKPDNKSRGEQWYSVYKIKNQQMARSLALLFMAEITKEMMAEATPMDEAAILIHNCLEEMLIQK